MKKSNWISYEDSDLKDIYRPHPDQSGLSMHISVSSLSDIDWQASNDIDVEYEVLSGKNGVTYKRFNYEGKDAVCAAIANARQRRESFNTLIERINSKILEKPSK